MSDSEDELSIKDEVQGPPSDSDDDLPISEVMRKRIIKIEKRKLAEKEKERDTKSSPSSSSDLKAVKRRKLAEKGDTKKLLPSSSSDLKAVKRRKLAEKGDTKNSLPSSSSFLKAVKREMVKEKVEEPIDKKSRSSSSDKGGDKENVGGQSLLTSSSTSTNLQATSEIVDQTKSLCNSHGQAEVPNNGAVKRKKEKPFIDKKKRSSSSDKNNEVEKKSSSSDKGSDKENVLHHLSRKKGEESNMNASSLLTSSTSTNLQATSEIVDYESNESCQIKLKSILQSSLDKVIKIILFNSEFDVTDEILLKKEFWETSEDLTRNIDYKRIWLEVLKSFRPDEMQTKSSAETKPLEIDHIIQVVKSKFQRFKTFTKDDIINILNQLSSNGMDMSKVKIDKKRNGWLINWHKETFDKIIKRIATITFLDHHKKYEPVNAINFTKENLHDFCLLNDATKIENQELDDNMILSILKFVANNKVLIKQYNDIFSYDITLPKNYIRDPATFSTENYDNAIIDKRFEGIMNYMNASNISDDARQGKIINMRERLTDEATNYKRYKKEEDILIVQTFKSNPENYISSIQGALLSRGVNSIKARLKKICINCFLYYCLHKGNNEKLNLFSQECKYFIVKLFKESLMNKSVLNYTSLANEIIVAAEEYVKSTEIDEETIKQCHSTKSVTDYLNSVGKIIYSEANSDWYQKQENEEAGNNMVSQNKKSIESTSSKGTVATKQSSKKTTKDTNGDNNSESENSNSNRKKRKILNHNRGGADSGRGADGVERADSGYTTPFIGLNFHLPPNTVVEKIVDDSTKLSLEISLVSQCDKKITKTYVMSEASLVSTPIWIETSNELRNTSVNVNLADNVNLVDILSTNKAVEFGNHIKNVLTNDKKKLPYYFLGVLEEIENKGKKGKKGEKSQQSILLAPSKVIGEWTICYSTSIKKKLKSFIRGTCGNHDYKLLIEPRACIYDIESNKGFNNKSFNELLNLFINPRQSMVSNKPPTKSFKDKEPIVDIEEIRAYFKETHLDFMHPPGTHRKPIQKFMDESKESWNTSFTKSLSLPDLLKKCETLFSDQELTSDLTQPNKAMLYHFIFKILSNQSYHFKDHFKKKNEFAIKHATGDIDGFLSYLKLEVKVNEPKEFKQLNEILANALFPDGEEDVNFHLFHTSFSVKKNYETFTSSDIGRINDPFFDNRKKENTKWVRVLCFEDNFHYYVWIKFEDETIDACSIIWETIRKVNIFLLKKDENISKANGCEANDSKNIYIYGYLHVIMLTILDLSQRYSIRFFSKGFSDKGILSVKVETDGKTFPFTKNEITQDIADTIYNKSLNLMGHGNIIIKFAILLMNLEWVNCSSKSKLDITLGCNWKSTYNENNKEKYGFSMVQPYNSPLESYDQSNFTSMFDNKSRFKPDAKITSFAFLNLMGNDSMASTKKKMARGLTEFRTDIDHNDNIKDELKKCIDDLNASKICLSFMAYVSTVCYMTSRTAGLAASKQTYCPVNTAKSFADNKSVNYIHTEVTNECHLQKEILQALKEDGTSMRCEMTFNIKPVEKLNVDHKSISTFMKTKLAECYKYLFAVCSRSMCLDIDDTIDFNIIILDSLQFMSEQAINFLLSRKDVAIIAEVINIYWAINTSLSRCCYYDGSNWKKQIEPCFYPQVMKGVGRIVFPEIPFNYENHIDPNNSSRKKIHEIFEELGIVENVNTLIPNTKLQDTFKAMQQSFMKSKNKLFRVCEECLNVQESIHHNCLNSEKCSGKKRLFNLLDEVNVKNLLRKYHKILSESPSQKTAFDRCIWFNNEAVSVHGIAGSGKSLLSKVVILYYAFYLGIESIGVVSYQKSNAQALNGNTCNSYFKIGVPIAGKHNDLDALCDDIMKNINDLEETQKTKFLLKLQNLKVLLIDEYEFGPSFELDLMDKIYERTLSQKKIVKSAGLLGEVKVIFLGDLYQINGGAEEKNFFKDDKYYNMDNINNITKSQSLASKKHVQVILMDNYRQASQTTAKMLSAIRLNNNKDEIDEALDFINNQWGSEFDKEFLVQFLSESIEILDIDFQSYCRNAFCSVISGKSNEGIDILRNFWNQFFYEQHSNGLASIILRGRDEQDQWMKLARTFCDNVLRDVEAEADSFEIEKSIKTHFGFENFSNSSFIDLGKLSAYIKARDAYIEKHQEQYLILESDKIRCKTDDLKKKFFEGDKVEFKNSEEWQSGKIIKDLGSDKYSIKKSMNYPTILVCKSSEKQYAVKKFLDYFAKEENTKIYTITSTYTYTDKFSSTYGRNILQSLLANLMEKQLKDILPPTISLYVGCHIALTKSFTCVKTKNKFDKGDVFKVLKIYDGTLSVQNIKTGNKLELHKLQETRTISLCINADNRSRKVTVTQSQYPIYIPYVRNVNQSLGNQYSNNILICLLRYSVTPHVIYTLLSRIVNEKLVAIYPPLEKEMIQVDTEKKKYLEMIAPEHGTLSYVLYYWNKDTKRWELKNKDHFINSIPVRKIRVFEPNAFVDEDHYLQTDENDDMVKPKLNQDEEVNNMETAPGSGLLSAFWFYKLPDRANVLKNGDTNTLTMNPLTTNISSIISNVKQSSDEKETESNNEPANQQSDHRADQNLITNNLYNDNTGSETVKKKYEFVGDENDLI
jgi:hypothetical protein